VKKKTLIIVIAIVAVMAVFSATAYAWFTWDAMNSSAQIGSGDMTATLESDRATVSIAGLMPSNGGINEVVYYRLTNTGDADASFAHYVDPASFWGNAELSNHLCMSVVLPPTTGTYPYARTYGADNLALVTNGWAKDIWGASNALNNFGLGVEPLLQGHGGRLQGDALARWPELGQRSAKPGVRFQPQVGRWPA